MSNLIEFSEEELNKLLDTCETEEDKKMQKQMNDDILDVIKTFSRAGHTGFTASYALNVLNKLLRYQPLLPLTGEDDEWTELDYTDEICYQNKRCPSVFKNKDGKAYYTEARIFSKDNGHTWFTSKDSSAYISFPFEVPLYSEQVIIDNKKERETILKTIIDIVNDKIKPLNGNITEEANIGLTDEECNQLQDLLAEKYKITKAFWTIKPEEDLWSIVNFVMESDKEEN